jgi:hypothetical protein
MIVSLIALFVAMGGTTYAVTSLPERSVGSAQLKRGAVRKENIAKGAVTASKLAKGLVYKAPAGKYAEKAGYAERAGKSEQAKLADRATLADNATSATSAGSAASAGTAANADTLDGRDSSFFLSRATLVDIPRSDLGPGQTSDVTIGPFKFKERCLVDQAGIGSADVLIWTTQDHSAFDGDAISADLLVGSAEPERRFIFVESPMGAPAFKASNDGTAVMPGGGEARSVVFYTGINLFGTSGRCYFGGLAIV